MKKTVLAIDIGNTHSVVGCYKNNILAGVWRLQTNKTRTEDEYFVHIKQLLLTVDINIDEIKIVGLSSVVPSLTPKFKHLTDKYFKNAEFVNITANLDLGIKYPCDDPSFIGADLVVNAYSAIEKYNKACIICDFGTATTIQAISVDRFFIGTAIMPGVVSSANILFEKASQLASIKLGKPDNLLGTNTAQALKAGIVGGTAAMLDEYIKRIKKEYATYGGFIAIATGGIAPLICDLSKEIDIVDKTLTLDGIYKICGKINYDA